MATYMVVMYVEGPGEADDPDDRDEMRDGIQSTIDGHCPNCAVVTIEVSEAQ